MGTDGTDLETMESGIGFEQRHRGGRPPGHTAATTTHRRREVAALLASKGGMTGREVAEELGISESTASRDIAAVKKIWRDEMLEDVDAMVARDLAELGLVKNEAWRCYVESCEVGDKVVTVAETKDGTFETVTESNPKASLHALKLVQSCIEKKRKILGLDKEEVGSGKARLVSFTVKIGDRVLVSEASTAEPEDDILDAEVVELDSRGKALPSGTEGE
jgi:DNA-binding CsgD family transcriptional regulator